MGYWRSSCWRLVSECLSFEAVRGSLSAIMVGARKAMLRCNIMGNLAAAFIGMGATVSRWNAQWTPLLRTPAVVWLRRKDFCAAMQKIWPESLLDATTGGSWW